MHEASLMSDLMAKIDEIARAEGAAKVARVEVWLGALSHFSAEHFREHFERAASGTLAEGADLRVTLSDNLSDPNAQQVMLQSVELED